MSFLAPLLGMGGRAASAGIALKIGEKAYKAAKDKGIELFGYDFFGLIQKIVIFYVVALVIAKYYEAVKLGSGFIAFIAGLFGYEVPKAFPESLMRFFDTGYNGIKYWDLVHIIAILLVAAEAMRHDQSNQPAGMNPTSWGIFGGIIGFLGLISIPDMLQRMKEVSFLTGAYKDGGSFGHTDDTGLIHGGGLKK